MLFIYYHYILHWIAAKAQTDLIGYFQLVLGEGTWVVRVDRKVKSGYTVKSFKWFYEI